MFGDWPSLDDLKNDPGEDEKYQKAILQSMMQIKRKKIQKPMNLQERAKKIQVQPQPNANSYQPIAILTKKSTRPELKEPIKNNNKNMSYEIKRPTPQEDLIAKYTTNKKQALKTVAKQINPETIKQKQSQSKLKEQNSQLKKLIEQLANENEVFKKKSETKIRKLQQEIKLLKNQIQKDKKNQSQNIGRCKACLDKPATYANIPCMHVNLCNDCAVIPVYKKACITCREVGEYKKIFLSSIPEK